MAEIIDIRGRQIIDSRGNPTVDTRVFWLFLLDIILSSYMIKKYVFKKA